MAKNQTSAQKRHRQSEVRRLRNRIVRSKCRTSVKRFLEAIESKDQKLADEKFNALQSEFDSAHGKGVIKRNAAARKKSRMMKLYHKTFDAPKTERPEQTPAAE